MDQWTIYVTPEIDGERSVIGWGEIPTKEDWDRVFKERQIHFPSTNVIVSEDASLHFDNPLYKTLPNNRAESYLKWRERKFFKLELFEVVYIWQLQYFEMIIRDAVYEWAFNLDVQEDVRDAWREFFKTNPKLTKETFRSVPFNDLYFVQEAPCLSPEKSADEYSG